MKTLPSYLLASCFCFSLCFGTDTYTTRSFDHVKTLQGFSSLMMENHLKLYQGYVTQTNNLLTLLEKTDLSIAERSELRRRLGWEMSGMRMHELYFENLGTHEISNEAFKVALISQFGSLQNWQQAFEAIGTMRGIGWAVLYWDSQSSRFIHAWVGEHDVGQLPSCTPLLVMDVWEHAYMTDYQIDRARYIQNFIKEINWSVVQERWIEAKGH